MELNQLQLLYFFHKNYQLDEFNVSEKPKIRSIIRIKIFLQVSRWFSIDLLDDSNYDQSPFKTENWELWSEYSFMRFPKNIFSVKAAL